MKTTKRKASTIILDNIFSDEDIRDISDAIIEAIKKASSKKRKQIMQAFEKK